ncbi:hypothetical protein BTA51_05165 [Hahella sp. CCB-MM4]|uniref:FliM/FliN family flagellar motor switch protein n=1 Tax=Hahella sp. (strain CCB-MM4) TaxID=1926491 RepID=UPI000B9A8209|nr:FliM/FliN family flagellar motor switch protein [Hahella sp. CCB-MM4]OZG74400.1 hypothetical protein BTA51_05165 [Hahella sp. CCB-MM4]
MDHNSYQTEIENTSPEIRSLRPELPSIPDALLQQINILHSRGIYAKVNVDSKLSHWRFQYERRNAKHWIKLKSEEKHLWLAIDSDHWNQPVNDKHWTHFHRDHQPLTFSLAHKHLLDHLDELTGISWRVEEVSHHECFPQENSMHLKFLVEYQDQLTVGTMTLCPSTLLLLTKRPIWERANLPFQNFISDLQLPLDIRMTGEPIKYEELLTLRPGDIFLAGTKDALLSQLRLVHSSSNRPLWNLAKHERQYVLCSIFSPAVSPEKSLQNKTTALASSHKTMKDVMCMNQENPSQQSLSNDDSPLDPKVQEQEHYKINDLPIDINILVGKLSLSIDELNQLEPGHTLKIPSEDHTREATLLANGHPVGRGELVIVGDQLGIRITELG